MDIHNTWTLTIHRPGMDAEVRTHTGTLTSLLEVQQDWMTIYLDATITVVPKQVKCDICGGVNQHRT